MKITDIPIEQRYGRVVFMGRDGNAWGHKRTKDDFYWSDYPMDWREVPADTNTPYTEYAIYSCPVDPEPGERILGLDEKLEIGDLFFCTFPGEPARRPENVRPGLLIYFEKTVRQLVTENANVFAVARKVTEPVKEPVNTAAQEPPKNQQFWMVMRLSNDEVQKVDSLPHVRHATLELAKAEAERLAKASPGTTFTVLQSYGQCVHRNDSKRENVCPAKDLETDACNAAWEKLMNAKTLYYPYLRQEFFEAGWKAAKGMV